MAALLPVKIVPDKVSEKIDHRDFAHPILLHDDLIEPLEDDRLGRRLKLVLSHLASHGRTSIVKGCKDTTNRGWLRTPVSGNHQYLWWTRQGSDHVTGLDLPPKAIVVRAVRHHDDHSPLHADQRSAFIDWQAVDQNAGCVPWTEEQIKFVTDEQPVRILQGNPGSGKTTALWQAVAARDGQTVVYLTWSARLARMAEEHFQTFAGKGVNLFHVFHKCTEILNDLG
jgi:hypothetical protein